ncbi:MAG TPA: hypothetical protein DCZ95_10700 [Verrucomicrobia bacterium]|nr:MAG: hypothetical protein A2X46_18445 [Lentisphaerae bacterium GWF2_57_35]HBA84552.1 hypothetical protein [Verrucomicrobiota bacterium]
MIAIWLGDGRSVMTAECLKRCAEWSLTSGDPEIHLYVRGEVDVNELRGALAILKPPYWVHGWFDRHVTMEHIETIQAHGSEWGLDAAGMETAAPRYPVLPSVLFLPLMEPVADPALWLKVVDAIKPSRRVVLGAMWPSRFERPGIISPDRYSVWGKLLVELAAELSARRLDVEFACGLPLCLFSRPQLAQLTGTRIRWPAARCQLQLAVLPDGTLRLCPAMDGRGMNLDASVSRADVMAGWPAVFQGWCERAGGTNCRSLATGACGVGCLAQSMSGWQAGR